MAEFLIKDIKAFIGSKDYVLSKKFYTELGWKLEYESDELSLLEMNGLGFYLQNYYVEDWCNNTMLHISVDDAQGWYERARSVIDGSEYGVAKVAASRLQDYGALVTFVWDPVGVLLHFAQNITKS